MRRWTQRQGECEQALGSKKHALVKKTPSEMAKLQPALGDAIRFSKHCENSRGLRLVALLNSCPYLHRGV